MKSIGIAILVCLTLLNGCKENPTSETKEPDKKTEVILPLVVNNRWIGRNEFYDTNGVVIQEYYDTLIVTNDTIVNGENWYTTNKNPNDYITNRSDGLYHDIVSPYRVFIYPGKVNDSVSISPGNFVKIISISDTIEVVGKKFITYKYLDYSLNSWDKNNASYYFYFAPNVGLIKTEIIGNHLPTRKFLWGKREIVSYSIK